MAKKVKIEFEDEDGTKIKIEIPYNDPEKIYLYLKSLQSLSSTSSHIQQLNDRYDDKKIIEKVEELIKLEFGASYFTLSDIYALYKLKYNEEIPKSTLSTYLNRLYEYGVLDRIGKRGRYKFRYLKSVNL